MVLIDYEYEDRLVDRIAVNEAIAARLNPRQRRVLLRYTRYGETYREIARREGVSVERIRQLHLKAIGNLCKPLVAEPLKPIVRNAPPLGFDKAAFLRHMRLLIELREQHAKEAERLEFAIERAEVARLVAGEAAKNAPQPLPNTLKIKPPVQYTVHKADHSVYYSTLSYHPPPLPTLGDLNRIAQTAMMYLLSAYPPFDGTQTPGNPCLGKWCTSVVFTRDGGEVSEAVNSIVRELPAHARLSAFPVPVENGTLGVNATTPFASLRVTVTPDGMKLRFDVTWD